MSIRRPADHQLSQNDPAAAALLKDHAYQRDTMQTGLVSTPSRELGPVEAGVGDQPVRRRFGVLLYCCYRVGVTFCEIFHDPRECVLRMYVPRIRYSVDCDLITEA